MWLAFCRLVLENLPLAVNDDESGRGKKPVFGKHSYERQGREVQSASCSWVLAGKGKKKLNYSV